MKNFVCLIAFLVCINFVYAQKTLTPTDEGSKVHFVIKNFGLKTGGDFSGLKGTIKIDPNNVNLWSFDVTVEASTINTGNNSRDGHLRKEEYFDVTRFQTIRIHSTRITTTSAGVYQFIGNVTIKGVTKPLQFSFKVNTSGNGYLFRGGFDINRRNFGVGGNSVSLGDNLKVDLAVIAK